MSFNRLTWGVKASFRNYVDAVGGSVCLSDGATRAEDGTFVFKAAAGGDLTIAPDGVATGAMKFQGTVTFEAHGGMLKVILTELGLEAGSDGLVLTALQAPLNKDRCTIARLGPVEDGQHDPITLRAEITLDGMYQIADNYPPGTELDPVRLGVAVHSSGQ
ncbi:MAG: HtaA domain-containing protein [Proteobacteria bacterium]|jgi:hypothetical protein|nr:HtaA domain-containing protein [Pseudomonadota bacterium]